MGLACFVAVSALALGEDRFAIAIGAHDKLTIFGPKGDRIAKLSVPTIAQAATVGDVSFQVSYGKDSGGKLTAILTPSATTPAPLHFNVMGKAIDAENAVVTLTFASNLKSVIVDPGYVGSVEVNSHRLRRHNLAEELAPVPVILPKPVIAPVAVATSEASDSATSVPAASPVAAPAPTPAANISQSLAPATMASQLAPVLGQETSDPSVASDGAKKPSTTEDVATTSGYATERVKLYWSEPVTGPDGNAPACSLDEIKLVEMHGSISVTLPNGEAKAGYEGMTVPSGSSVVTEDNSSVALFMGGVNSARLMPRCELTVTQTFDGTTRKNTLDLTKGAFFSRVGKRAGEVEDYQIRTPEGSTGAESANMLAFRGTADDVPSDRTAMTGVLNWSRHELLAWNPAPLGRNLISDVVNPLISASGSTTTSTMFFFAPNTKAVNLSQIPSLVLASNQSTGQNGPSISGIPNPNTVLQGYLQQVAPLNTKLNALLAIVNGKSGAAATPSQLAFYHGLVTVFFDSQVPNIAKLGLSPSATTNATTLALLRDLKPFAVPAATPF